MQIILRLSLLLQALGIDVFVNVDTQYEALKFSGPGQCELYVTRTLSTVLVGESRLHALSTALSVVYLPASCRLLKCILHGLGPTTMEV